MGKGGNTIGELFMGNTPQGASDFFPLEFLHAAMKQVRFKSIVCWHGICLSAAAVSYLC